MLVRKFSSSVLPLVAATCGVFALTHASPAKACGGLFCNNVAPVLQAAENIIFSHGDDVVTAVVQVQYTGTAEEFSWLIPVPGIPVVGVSSNTVFTQLNVVTAPQYTLTTLSDGECRARPPSPPGSVADGGSFDVDGGEPDPIDVVASGTAGPYVYEVISVDPELPNIVDVATAWLTENGYEVAGEDVLADYLGMGMNLIGFKLQNGEEVTAIRPITLAYQTEAPMVPIRLTAVAATPQMGVRIWTLGQNRHVPTNYRSLELNLARMNWFNPFSTYNQLVDEAAEEAGGHGFITEAAGGTAVFEDLIWTDQQEQMWQALIADETSTDGEFLVESTWLLRAFPAEFSETAEAELPLIDAPTGQTIRGRDLVNCPSCYDLESLDDIPDFDRAEYIAALTERVVGPLQQSQALLTLHPNYTRHYTSMGPDDMDEDPIFDEDPELSAVVERQRNATLTRHCGDQAYFFSEAPWTLVLPNGLSIEGQFFDTSVYLDDTPANAEINQEAIDAPEVTVIDNTDVINAAASAHNDSFVPIGGSQAPEPDPSPTAEPEQGPAAEPEANALDGGVSLEPEDLPPRRNAIPFCACASAKGSAEAPAFALLAFGLIFAVSRRRKPALRQ